MDTHEQIREARKLYAKHPDLAFSLILDILQQQQAAMEIE